MSPFTANVALKFDLSHFQNTIYVVSPKMRFSLLPDATRHAIHLNPEP
ncbi:hypothetical protein PLANPX_1607 [Lacipirellula parvula]|uniref:Uncharacterized protein n=1 Tax=Lacipirellula parvula TaxID=2650471 RepID=A0A5K7X6K2_9BACT|nr:hypothetical protein PLANPX_1607 [Lacipirellula parvula]